jgi:rSAM/selenodomain-associated transferase 1
VSVPTRTVDVAIIVFAKTPRPGEVKTRLTPEISPSDAAELYAAFVIDSLEQYRQLGPDIRLYVPDPEGFSDAIDTGLQPLRQRGAGLGPRMSNAFLETFAAGYGRVVIVGTDHPSLPVAFVEKSLDALQESGAGVIGPAEDGGYYLLGMSDFRGILFDGMAYSHRGVFEETLSRMVDCNLRVTVLPEWYDVDEIGDLVRLRDDLSGSASVAPRTRAVLDMLSDRCDALQKGP